MIIENKDEIKDASDIVNVITSYIKLQKKGRYYMGLCPFHDEKTPSFSVNPDTQSYYCFGCQASGDVIKFVQDFEKIDFSDAVEKLANRAGIAIHLSGNEKITSLNNQLLTCLSIAMDFFHHCLLYTDSGRPAINYLESREISIKTIKKYKLGYSPERWEGLYNLFYKKKLPYEFLLESGLILPNSNGTSGYYDRFRNRIMFPIFSRSGQVVGFGGRSFGKAIPKYLNSPETPVFKKSRILYGQNWAKKSIREQGQAIIVEGYMDALSLYQSGIENVVASLGTAFTADHAKSLLYDCARCLLAYDGDRAGQAATIKGLKILQNSGIKVNILELPNGMDPDDVVKSFGPEWFTSEAKYAKNIYEYLITAEINKNNVANPGSIADTIRNCFEIINDVETNVELNEYLVLISRLLGLRESDLRNDYSKYKTSGKLIISAHIKTSADDNWLFTEKLLLKTMIAYAENGIEFKLSEFLPEQFTNFAAYAIYKKLVQIISSKNYTGFDDFCTNFENNEEINLLNSLRFEGFSCEDSVTNINELAFKFELASVCHKINDLQSKINDDKANMGLLSEISVLQKKRIEIINSLGANKEE